MKGAKVFAPLFLVGGLLVAQSLAEDLQDTANTWLAEVSYVKKDQLDEMVKKKEMWIDGRTMLKMCFADRLLGEKK